MSHNGNKIILNIDDVEVSRDTTTHILTGAGFKVWETSLGLEILAGLLEAPDLVLLSINLSDVSGIEICKRIRAHAETRDVPLLCISSGGTFAKDQASSLNHRVDGFLIQPVQPDELVTYIDTLLRLKETEHKLSSSNRLLVLLHATNQAIVRIKDCHQLFQEICKIAVGINKFSMAGIGLLDERTGEFKPVAHCGDNAGFLEGLIVNFRESSNAPFSGDAISPGKVFTVDDIRTDAGIFPWCKEAIKCGYRSLAVVPITKENKFIGNLVIYDDRPNYFTLEEKGLLEEIGTDISYALGTIEAEAGRRQAVEMLKESEIRFSTAFRSGPAIIALTTLKEGKFIEVNDNYLLSTGYSREELIGRTTTEINIWANADDRARMFGILKEKGRIIKSEYHFRTKSGQIRTWLFSGEPVDIVGEPCLIGIAVDVTERIQAAEKNLRQSALLEAINQVFQQALQCETYTEVAHTCLDVAQRLTGSKFGWIGEINSSGRLDTIALSNPAWDCCKIPEDQSGQAIRNMEIRGIWSRVLKDGKSLISNHPANHPDSVGLPVGHPPLTAFLGIPLKDAGRTFGMISLANKSSGYELNDLEAVEALSASLVEVLKRKLAEEALRESEAFNSEILNNAFNPTMVTNQQDTSIRYVNSALEKLTGFSSAELVGRKIPYPWWPSPDSAGAFPHGIPENEVNIPEFACRKKDGTPFWVSFNYKPVKENGKTKYLLGSWVDITERKQAEEALKASEEKYRTLVNNLKLGISRSTPGDMGKFVEVNPALGEITGYSREELLKIDVCDLYASPRERKVFSQAIARSHGKLHREFRFKRKDGSEIIVAVTNVAVRNDSGDIIYFDGILEDITERKKAEEQLISRALLVDNVSDAIVSTSLDAVILSWNKAAERIYGWKLQEVLGQKLTDILQIENLSGRTVQGLIGQLEDTGFWTGESIHKRRDGVRLNMSCSICRIKDSSDKPIGSVGIFRDITEQKKAEARAVEMETLRQLDNAKSELLANVSHELRTPLASIKGFIETLIEKDVKWTRKEQLDFLLSANQEVDHLAFLIRDLLDMSRLDSGKLTLDKRSCSVSEVLSSARPVMTLMAANHKLSIKLSPHLPPIQVDKLRIIQVITNLIENAAKFSPEGSPITIEAKSDNNSIVISVQDKGEGISPEVMGNLFNRFYQAQRVVSGKTRGTGLGLAICKGIIEAHGGKIWVESQVGGGSTFHFSIPVK